MIAFIQSQRLVTIPADLGAFHIRQLPEAFKPTSPGGFMNPPGLYDKDPTGFFYIPTYNPKSGKNELEVSLDVTHLPKDVLQERAVFAWPPVRRN